MVKMVDMDETVEMVETAILNRLEKVLKFWGFFLYRHPYGLKVFVLFLRGRGVAVQVAGFGFAS
jgi:hypothetical protein